MSPGGLIGIFLFVNEVDGPSVCLPTLHMSSLAKYLFRSLKNKLFILEEFYIYRRVAMVVQRVSASPLSVPVVNTSCHHGTFIKTQRTAPGHSLGTEGQTSLGSQ